MPWIERLWDTPNVAHDNSTDQRFHASLILGFADTNALRAFFGNAAIATLSGKLPEFASAVHAYEVTDALTHVKDEQSPPALVRAPARTNFVAFERCGREPAPTRRLDCPSWAGHAFRPNGLRREYGMPDLIWIIVIVLVVLLLLGYFGRGRFGR